MMILAIDPGASMGWAAVMERTGDLIACGLNGCPWAKYLDTLNQGKVIIEFPSAKEARAAKIDPDDLLRLAYRAGRVAAQCEARNGVVELVQPVKWKGSISKATMCNRILADLNPKDRATAARDMSSISAVLQNNVLDAIGLGKWYAKSLATRDQLETRMAPSGVAIPKLGFRIR